MIPSSFSIRSSLSLLVIFLGIESLSLRRLSHRLMDRAVWRLALPLGEAQGFGEHVHGPQVERFSLALRLGLHFFVVALGEPDGLHGEFHPGAGSLAGLTFLYDLFSHNVTILSLRGEYSNMESNDDLKAYIREEIHNMETRLLTEFRKWAIRIEGRQRIQKDRADA